MALWIDRPAWPAHDTVFSHLVSDGGLEATGAASWVRASAELTDALAGAGLHPGWLDGDHADVPVSAFDDLLAAGAQLRSAREITAMLTATGQRLRKRKAEKCLTRTVVDEGHRVDLVRSAAGPVGAAGSATMEDGGLVVADGAGRVLLVPGEDGWGLLQGVGPQGVAGGVPGRDVGGPSSTSGKGALIGYEEEVRREGGVLRRQHRAYRLQVVGGPDGLAAVGAAWSTGAEAPAPIDGARWVGLAEGRDLVGGASWWPLVTRGMERGWGV